jgi:hypothetical protein
MERDEEIGTLYDAGEREDRAYDEWAQRQLDDEREQMAEAALTACKVAGVPDEHLRTLAQQLGCVRWALENSLR